MAQDAIAPGLLLAMPQLEDPNFQRSVVLMVEHNDGGSFGLVVNRPTELQVSDVMATLDVAWHGDPAATVWTGGPVMPGTGWLLHEPVDLPEDEGFVPISPGLHLSTSPERLRALATQPPHQVRFLLGYAGWAAAQLEYELAASSWLLAEATPELVFNTPADEMWAAALRTLGVDPATLVPAMGVH